MFNELVSGAEQAVEKMPLIGDAGTKVSLAVHNAILGGGEVTRDAADLLHGTWLGHPLHPVLTDLTIGAWVIGGMCDGIGAVADSDSFRQMGDRLACIGTISAVPTALTGLTDFSTFPDWSANAATLHGVMNVINVGLYALSVRERRRGYHGRGVAYSTVALALSCISAWLGGMLVYKHKVGVDHADGFDGPRNWKSVLDEADLPDGKPKRVMVDDKPVMLLREGERVYAIGATCSHAGGPLDEGKIDGHCVQCPWHDSVFDVRDGRLIHGPATQPQPAFSARIREGQIEIRLQEK